jgi:hypothetical protein
MSHKNLAIWQLARELDRFIQSVESNHQSVKEDEVRS